MPPSNMPFVPPGQPEKGHRISDKYVLGAQIGKGAFGTVYECQNQETAEIVAVKRVPLRNLTPEQLRSLEQEIEVLKILNHPNIVKYIATVRTRNHVHIVLQYMENGSLAQNIKKFGVFPPSLVALFTRQILQGLVYLHEQGVIHRDIKGANILSDKRGRVKLADFGVAVRTRGSSANNSDSVVGTPYWMAPEIIDMLAPTSACDVWSVGCTVIELLTSKPPYADVPTAAAMYRIVQSPKVPLPENIPPEVVNFLELCFIKQPSSRPTAHELLDHEWIKSSLGANELRASAQRSSLGTPRDVDSSQGADYDENPAQGPASMLPTSSLMAARPKMGSIASAQSRSSVSSYGSNPVTKHRHSLPGQVYDSISFDQDPAVPSPVGITSLSMTANDRSSWRFSQAPPLSAVGEHDNEDWDKEMGITQDSQQGILWAGRSQRVQKDEMTRPRSMRGIEQMVQRRAVEGAPLVEGARGALVGPAVQVVEGENELERAFEGDRDISSVNNPSVRPTGSAAARKKKGMRLAKFRESADDADFGDFAGDDIRKQAGNLATNLAKRKERESGAEEDASSGFTSPDALGLGGSDEMGRSVRARKAAEVQELIAKLKQTGTPGSQALVVAAADKLVEMFQDTPALKRTLLTHHGVTPLLETLSRAGEEEARAILRILNEASDNDRNFQELLTMAGIVPLLTKLAGRESPLETRKLAGNLVSHFLCTSPITLHMFVACGGLITLVSLLDSKGEAPPIIELAVIAVDGVQRVFAETVAPPGSHRRASIARAAALAEARGNGIVGVPKNDFCLLFAKTPLLDRLAALGHRLQSQEGKRECGKCGVAPVGVLAEVCHIFVVFSQGGPQAKTHLADCSKALRFILSTIVTRWAAAAGTHDAVLEDDVDDDIDTVKTLLNCVKNLASESLCLDALDSAGVVQALVPFLTIRHESTEGDAHTRQMLRKRRAIPAVAAAISEVHNTAMLVLFYMLRLSPARQERAAVCGIIPLAKSAVLDRTTVKTFAMQILVDMAHTSDFTRHCLFRDGALEFFLDTLVTDDPFWQERALQAIEQFLLPCAAPVGSPGGFSSSPSKGMAANTSLTQMTGGRNGDMERFLLRPYVLGRFVELFQSAKSEYFETAAKAMLSMLEASPKLAEAIGRSGLFVAEITARLSYPKAEVRINLLKLLSIISKSHTDLESMLLEHNLPAIITMLSKSAKAAKLVVVATHADNLLQMWKTHLDKKDT